MSNLYKTAYRGYLVDHHSPDTPIITLDKLDPKEYETFFKEANITSLMVYTKDHWGASYYNTKVGKKHPGLGDRDWIAELREVLTRNKIEFNAYYCLEYDTYAPVAHPEWAIVKPDGTPLICASPIAHWKMPCYETGYRQYVLDQLNEIAENYHPDSLFLDIFGKSLCYCPSCRAKFEKECGYPLPEKDEEIVAHYQDINNFLDRSASSMLDDIRAVMQKHVPDIKITVNFAALYCKDIRDKLDYQFTEPFAGNWLSAAYARDTAVGQYPQLGPGDVSEVYNYRNKNIYKLAAAQIAAQGCRVFMYSGSQHPDGTLEHEEAQHVGAAYQEVEKFEKYLSDREVIADIAILQSDVSASINNHFVLVPNAIGRVKQGSVHRTAVMGAMKLCDASGMTWKIVPEQDVSTDMLKKFRMVILPNVFHVSEKLHAALKAFVEGGGYLILSGLTGMFEKDGKMRSNFALADLMGAGYIGEITRYKDAKWGGYLEPSEHPLLKSISRTYAPVGSVYYQVRTTGAEILTRFVYPATELTANTWVNWWCPPPKTPTNDPAILLNSCGKGQVFYAAFDMMAETELNYLDGIFGEITATALKEPSIALETGNHHALGFVAYDRPSHQEVIVHEVSHIAEHFNGDAPAVDGGILLLDQKKYSLKGAELVYPETKPLVLETENGFWKVKLPEIEIHQVIRLTY